MLAYVFGHCVIGLTLPPIDANQLFINELSSPEILKKTLVIVLAK